MTVGETNPFDGGLRPIRSPWRNTWVSYHDRCKKGHLGASEIRS